MEHGASLDMTARYYVSLVRHATSRPRRTKPALQEFPRIRQHFFHVRGRAALADQGMVVSRVGAAGVLH